MIRWFSNVLLGWSIKLSRYADKLDGQVDNAFAKLDKEVDRIKRQIKAEL